MQFSVSEVVDVRDNDGVSRGESARDRCHRPMSHALHSDCHGPQLYIPAGCSGEVAALWPNSYDGSDQKYL